MALNKPPTASWAASGGRAAPLTLNSYRRALKQLLEAGEGKATRAFALWPPLTAVEWLAEWDNDTYVLSSISEIMNHRVPNKFLTFGAGAIPHLIGNIQDPAPYQAWGCFALLERIGILPDPPEQIRGNYGLTRVWYVDQYYKSAPVEF